MPWSDAPLMRRARGGEPLGGARELEPRRVQQREVVEAGVAAGRSRGGLLDEHEQVLAAGAERGAPVLAAVDLQADRGLVEAGGAREVRDAELDGAHAQRGGEDGGGLGAAHDCLRC